jgi:hypothetical protein
MTPLVVLADGPTGEAAKSGPWGLAIILLLCAGCYFLFKSMSKHLRKVREEFGQNEPKPPGTEGAATDGPSGEGAATEGPATEGPATEGPATEGPATEAEADAAPAPAPPSDHDPGQASE